MMVEDRRGLQMPNSRWQPASQNSVLLPQKKNCEQQSPNGLPLQDTPLPQVPSLEIGVQSPNPG